MLDFAPLSAVLAGGTFSFVSIFMEPLTTTGTKNQSDIRLKTLPLTSLGWESHHPDSCN